MIMMMMMMMISENEAEDLFYRNTTAKSSELS
jgi:hypothetical protein